MQKHLTLVRLLVTFMLLTYASYVQSQVKDSTQLNFPQDSIQSSIKKDSSQKSLSDLSLEELMNIEIQVTVASKQSETLADAPGCITVYSDKDMENLGYYTLRDLASITAGYSAFKSIGETVFETRGQMQSGFDNNKHLVLVDGIPYNHTRANMALSEENLPLFFAKKVEFLKGPGSALYGTSAFLGAINITSKDPEENGSIVESKFSASTLDFKKRAMMNFINKSDEGVSKLSVSYFGKDATGDYLGNGQYPNANSRNNDNSTCLFINGSHKLSTTKLKGMGIGLLYSRKLGGLGEFWMFQQNQTYPINQLTWEQIVPYLKYERKISDKFTIQSYLKGNISTERAFTGGYQQTIKPAYNNLIFSHYNIRVYDKEWLGEGRFNFSSKTNLIAGINIISRYSTGAPESYAVYTYAAPGLTFQPLTTFYERSSTYNIYSGFVQLKHTINFLKGLYITAGARWDGCRTYTAKEKNLANKFDPLSPRIALVQKVTDRVNLKFMYGKALRAPLVKEVGLNKEIKATALLTPSTAAYSDLVPELSPETISSLEGSITYTTNRLSFTGTYFYNKTNNALGSRTIPELNNARVFSNFPGNITAQGFETDAQYSPVKNLLLRANYSFAHAKDSSENDVANVPTSKLNGFITYSIKSPAKFSLTLIGKWITNYRAGVVEPFIKNNGFATDNSLMPGFTVFDFNVVWKITSHIGLELQILNLLNEEIRTPAGSINSGMLNVPYPKRSFLGTVAFRF